MKERDAVGLGQRITFVMAVLLLFSAVAQGATYYVRTDGNDGNDGLANTFEGAWRTIDWAADHVSPGDVVRVQAGTYAERVSPGVSGEAENPITFVASGGVTFCGMDISNRNYVRVIGFTIDTNAGTCTKSNRAVAVSGTNTGLEFWNNSIRDANYAGIGSGSYSDRAHNFLVIGNTFTSIGGLGSAIALRGNNSLFAYNEVAGLDPDAFLVDGTYNRWLNNYIHNLVDTSGHSDVFQSNSSSLGLSYNLFEANFAVGSGNLADEHGVLLQNQSAMSCSTGTCGVVTENLFRYNVWHNISGGVIGVDQATVAPITNTRQVHDTIIDAMRTAPSAPYGVVFNGLGITAYLHNNLNYRAWGSAVTSQVQVFFATNGASIKAADYNLAYTPNNTPTYTTPWVTQTHAFSNLNPSFVDYPSQNFTLAETSNAIGVGGPLTRVSGSGTGTTFYVAAGGGGFFRGPNNGVKQYGGKLAGGDVITVGTTTRTVASVSGDAITVTSPFTWANGDSVYLGASTRPDIGAYPYRSGGLRLTARYTVANGFVTVTPSDISLVRFMVCYDDGIPTTVINSSPYICAAGNETVDVRVYPRYPSKLLSIPALEWTLAAPKNLRIIGK
jgi:hypothetical protein